MRKRDFLRLADVSRAEAEEIFGMASRLKRGAKGSHSHLLRGHAVAVVLEKASTRTRVSFEVGVAQIGGYPVVLSVEGSQLARGEPIRDTARVLAGYCDAIAFRTSSTARLLEMATAKVPVVNALSDDGHPLQVLCDLFTIEESFAARGDDAGLRGRRIAFVGDCSSNMARSWVEASTLFGFHLALGAPEGYFPPADELARAKGHVSLHASARDAVTGSDVINTDVWASMGQEHEATLRRERFAGWTVDGPLLAGAPATAIVLHCLPAHRGEEISDEAIESKQSRIWEQAENRLHVQKALLCWLLRISA